ncbi:MAG: hypothetical protein ACYC64_09730 [Armatimonadota bacterium]
MGTNPDGERYLAAVTAVADGTGNIAALMLNNKALGGGDWFFDQLTGAGQDGIFGATGLNNIGLLVRTSGKFAYVDYSTFTVDDGSGVLVKCVVPDEVALDSEWTYVSATGISSCEKVGNDLYRLLRVRMQSDITSY